MKLKREKEENNTDASEKRSCMVRQCRRYRLQKTTLRYCCSKLHPLFLEAGYVVLVEFSGVLNLQNVG